MEMIKDLASKYYRCGYQALHAIHKNSGGTMNHKHFYRFYKEEGLDLKRVKRRKKQIVERVPLELPDKPG